MQTLNRRIPAYLLALWGAMAILGALGYHRLHLVHSVSDSLLTKSAPAVRAALDVENAVHQVFLNTYYYCSYFYTPSKGLVSEEIGRAHAALGRYARLSDTSSDEGLEKLRGLVSNVEKHAIDCIQMTDGGMTPSEFGEHLEDLGGLQIEAAFELRRAANREHERMVTEATRIDAATSEGLRIYSVGAGLLLLATLLTAFRLSHAVLHPVRALTEAAGRFSGSELAVRVTDVFSGEFGLLARTFNGMAARIESAMSENGLLIRNIKESRGKFRDLYDNAPDGYHSVGPNGEILEINATELKWLGYSRKELSNDRMFGDLVAEESRPAFQRADDQLRQGKPITDLEIDLLRKDSSRVPVRANATPVCNDAGRFLHSRFTLRDISGEQELRSQLIQAQKLESVGTLAGGIAHDFNNLLTSMMGFSQLAMMDYEPGTPTHANLARVVHLGDQAADLIKQLLTFSRQTPSEKAPFSLPAMVKETSKVLKRTFPETINIETRVRSGVPNVNADATQMQQVLMNLCVNARDAMPDGGNLIVSLDTVTLDSAQAAHYGCEAGTWVKLSVTDTGTGIPVAVQERMFEPFYTTKEEGKGTGLGMSIVHGIVTSHEGALALDSELGRGTTIDILLPASQKSVVVPSSDPAAPPRGTEGILVVEDDRNVREIACAMLREQGYKTFEAPDGEHALSLYRDHGTEIDLVVTDLVMPGLSGTELGQGLAEMDPGVRVFVISGYRKTDDLLSGMPEGVAAGFLQKPFELRALARSVRDALDSNLTTA